MPRDGELASQDPIASWPTGIREQEQGPPGSYGDSAIVVVWNEGSSAEWQKSPYLPLRTPLLLPDACCARRDAVGNVRRPGMTRTARGFDTRRNALIAPMRTSAAILRLVIHASADANSKTQDPIPDLMRQLGQLVVARVAD